MGKKRRDILLMLLCLFVVFTFVFFSTKRINKLKKFGIVKIGFIYDYNLATKGSGSTLSYDFIAEGKKISSSKRYLRLSLSAAPNFRDRYFPVLYVPGDPSNNTLLTTPDDFGSFGMLYPDSLSWVRQYLNY